MPPIIVEEKCTGCEVCIAACPQEVLEIQVEPEHCIAGGGKCKA